MRHGRVGRKLGRTASHRKATLAALATALFVHKRITTTVAKAKEARGFAERLITFAKRGDLSARRHVRRFIHDRKVVKNLFDEIAPKYTERAGGYTRVVKLGQRAGDAAPLAILELVGYEGVQVEKARKAKEEREKRKKGEKK